MNFTHILDNKTLEKSLLKEDEIINKQNEEKINDEYIEEYEKNIQRDQSYDEDDYSDLLDF